MKPTPDDPHEMESPPTRAMFGTYPEEGASVVPEDLDKTLEGQTRRLETEGDSVLSRVAAGPRPGVDMDLQTGWSTGSEVPQPSSHSSRRGIVGKIEPGQTLYSKYSVLRKLGAGAMGDVWLVRHVMLKSQHALKVIVPNFATNAMALMRFQREFEVMATLRHEHAVTIYDACIDADGGYIDMEFVEGQTIHEVLGAARGRDDHDPSGPLMPLDWIVRILEQLCEVLQVAHQKGIVHRDLKPSNMMLLGDRPPGKEYLKVLDFGIAKVRDDPEGVAGRDQEEAEHKTQGFIGTPSYGSPEQAMGQEVDGRSDLYSVGIMLYEFVTGRLPFRGNHWQVMSQNASSPPPQFSETNPRLRPMPELESAIFRILAKDPNQRPQTARELFEEIRQAVEVVQPTGIWGPSSAGSSPDLAHAPLPREALPPTQGDGFGDQSPPTQADTLVARPPMGWKGGPAIDSPSDLGLPVGLAERGGTQTVLLGRSRPRRPIVLGVLIACAVLLVPLLIFAFKKKEATSDRRPPENLGSDAGKDRPVPNPNLATGTETRKKPVDFESYWPETYVPVEGYTEGMPWPEKVRRKEDSANFVKFADGIYIPEGFTIPDRNDLAADGWPRVIVRNEIRLIRIPGGTWNMGSWDDPNATDRHDGPAHPVQLTGYYLQETEVTHGQFEDFLLRVQDGSPPEWLEGFNELKARVSPDVARQYPTVNVSREKARKFAREMGGQFPTEAQWEYAARSLGQIRRYVWGDSPPPNRDLARIDSFDATPAPVASYPKDPGGQGKDRTEQGIFDMTGNVKEMCRDEWLSSYKKTVAAVLDPCAIPPDPSKAMYSIRGGDYTTDGKDVATTRREDKMSGADLAPNIGFRVVVECPNPRKSR